MEGKRAIQNARILIVDDQVANVRLLERILNSAGYTKLTSTTDSKVHYPPATSKWNKIDHRLFSYISINWRATPLTCMEVVLELISHTTTNEGLTVRAVTTPHELVKDSHIYPTGRKVTDDEVEALNLVREAFHGEWNYTISPQPSPSSSQLI